MIEFYKAINVSFKVSAGLTLRGNINDVINTLHNLSYIFRNRRLSDINLKEVAEAEKAINAVKVCKAKTSLRRRL